MSSILTFDIILFLANMIYYSCKIIFDSADTLEKISTLFLSIHHYRPRTQKVSIIKSPFIFKKSKERFSTLGVYRYSYRSPFFSSKKLLKIFLLTVVEYLYTHAVGSSVKFKIIVYKNLSSLAGFVTFFHVFLGVHQGYCPSYKLGHFFVVFGSFFTGILLGVFCYLFLLF